MQTSAEEILTRLSRGVRSDSVPPALDPLFRPSVQTYLISWFQYDPTDEIRKLKVPVLIIQGSTDLQVPVADANLLRNAAPSGGLIVIEGMNHILKNAPVDRQANLATYVDPSLPIVTRVPEEIAAFANRLKPSK